MIKYYCDRCGKEVNTVIGNDVEFYISDLASISSRTRMDGNLHLCEQCFKDFIDEFLYNMKEEPDGKK